MTIDVTEELVARVATLSRLELSPAERQAMLAHFRNVLGYVEDLQQLDLSDVDPSTARPDGSTSTRADEVGASLTNAQALAAAGASEPPFFVVPRIVSDAGDAARS